jgi:N-acetylmuramoyl-L-alanine amidase
MTIWAESRAELIEGEVAVGCIIRNRVLRPKRFGDTWKKVVHAHDERNIYQFSCWWPRDGQKNYDMLMSYCEAALKGERPWPGQQMWVAEGIISGAIEDRIGGADHYFADYIAEPRWWKNVIETCQIGVHRFGKEKV